MRPAAVLFDTHPGVHATLNDSSNDAVHVFSRMLAIGR